MLALSGLGIGAGGCRAEPPAGPGRRAAVAPALPLHWPVPAAPPLTGPQPLLWVGLAAQLRGPGELYLDSAAGSLRLRDAAGVQLEAPQLALRWTRQRLARPLHIRRLVLGPYASYESAAAVAERWRLAGAQPLVARPGEWEVWAPPESPPLPGQQPPLPGQQPALPGQQPRLLELHETWTWQPALRRAGRWQPLQGPLQLAAPGGLRWKGGVYPGNFRLQADAHGGWTLVEQLPLERYLLGVVPLEIGAAAPPAALAAQAVLARTWALRNQQRFSVDGYHLCADTQCQVYGDPGPVATTLRQAIFATRGQVLAWHGQPIHAVYHASNGGVAAGFEEGWNGAPLPYLQPQLDGPPSATKPLSLPLDQAAVTSLLRRSSGFYGAEHPSFRWQRLVDANALAAALRPGAPGLGQPNRIVVLERGASGRVIALEIGGDQPGGDQPGGGKGGGQGTARVVLRRDAIRRTIRQLPSTLFNVEALGPGRWRFVGAATAMAPDSPRPERSTWPPGAGAWNASCSATTPAPSCCRSLACREATIRISPH